MPLATGTPIDLAGHAVSIALVLGSIAAWFGVYGLALLATRPDMPPAQPATEDLGPEPPAIVSLVVNRWEITEDAAESTLLDLAARRILELRQPGNDPIQTTIHIRQPNPTGLTRYEQRVFDRVAALAVGGTVPLPALTFRDSAQASAWAKRLSADVIAEARTNGLSQRRLGPGAVTGLVAAAAAAALGAAVGVALWLDKQPHHHGTAKAAFWTAIVTWFVLGGIAGRSHGERDTPAGREVASRWLGVRAWLRGHDAFGDLPPAAVAVWDRYLSYGAAVGATRVSSAVIDLGMGNRRNVWSSYAAGGPPSWHRVRVHYPRFWPRYGKTAPKLLLKALILGGLGYLLVRFWYKAIDTVFTTSTFAHSAAVPYLTLIKSGGVLAGFAGMAYFVYVLIRTAVDLASPVTIVGEVVWTERWRSTGGENKTVLIDYLAVDEGSSDQTRAWAMPRGVGSACHAGDTVEFTVRRWSRRVTALTVREHGAAQRLAQLDVVSASENTERLIDAAMGIPAPRTGGGNGLAADILSGLGGFAGVGLNHPDVLLTAEEVGAALRIPVTMQPAAKPNPILVTSVFRGPDGSDALTVALTGGRVARMAMRSRQGQPIGGLGDEARGGPGWIAVRRGDYVALLHVDGPAAQSTSPQTLMDLANRVATRIPAQAN
jgi:hypothetical protein